MQSILFALIAYFGWAVGDVFGTIATRKIGAYSTTFWSFVFRIIIFSVYIPFALQDISRIGMGLFLLNVVLAIILVFSFFAFNEALRIGNASLVGTIAASFSALVVVFSLVFLGERINLNQALAILVIFIGVILSTLDFKTLKERKNLIDKGVFWALIAMLLWGVYFTFIKIPVRQIGWFWPHYISFCFFPLLFLSKKFREAGVKKPTYQNAFFPLLLGAVLVGVADFSYNFAIKIGLTAVVAPIAGSYPTLFAILAFIFFKDKIKKQQVAGIIITLTGIVLLSFLS